MTTATLYSGPSWIHDLIAMKISSGTNAQFITGCRPQHPVGTEWSDEGAALAGYRRRAWGTGDAGERSSGTLGWRLSRELLKERGGGPPLGGAGLASSGGLPQPSDERDHLTKIVDGPAVRLVDETDATLAAVLPESLAAQLGTRMNRWSVPEHGTSALACPGWIGVWRGASSSTGNAGRSSSNVFSHTEQCIVNTAIP
jgi:hypothetical protein